MYDGLHKGFHWIYWLCGIFVFAVYISFAIAIGVGCNQEKAQDEWKLYKDNYSCKLNTYSEILEQYRPKPRCVCKSTSGVELYYLQPKQGECKKER